jgi:hypothetical protein
MKSETAWNMFVFREGRRTVPGSTLARDVASAIGAVGNRLKRQNALISALLRAGELECALADAGSFTATTVAKITDELAEALVGDQKLSPEQLLGLIPREPPAELKIAPPEGFAYYALHPLDYSDMAASVALGSDIAAVIGIRSIGSTLSALVRAGLKRRGIHAIRTTVRPTGHPYNRTTQFTRGQEILVKSLAARGVDFLVADEGPGMSGSSFLSVGDALIKLGVPRERITFLCSRTPDADSLRAKDAGHRWRSFRALYARKNSRLPQEARLYIGGGEWRSLMLPQDHPCPASWTQMERLKFLSPDRKTFFKFEGFGHFGDAVHERSNAVAEAGFGPRALDFAEGFSFYPVVQGRAMTESDLSPQLLGQMASYCACRAREFRSEGAQDWRQTESMVGFNVAEEFGRDLAMPATALASNFPVIVDGRMMPYEWILLPDGRYTKVDNATHGDDHFFPGPTDIAWDLAGAIVEWRMDQRTAEWFVGEYCRMSGDNVRHRLPAFLTAYAVFRFAYCKMAAAALHGSAEEARLVAAYERYRTAAQGFIGQGFIGNTVEPVAA